MNGQRIPEKGRKAKTRHPPALQPPRCTVHRMPWKPPTRCTEPGCPELVQGSRCTKHAKQAQARRAARETWRDYGADWQRVRKLILKREPACRMCGQKATDVDHITPLKDGGTHDPSNLRPLCHSCHSRRTYYDTIAKRRDDKG